MANKKKKKANNKGERGRRESNASTTSEQFHDHNPVDSLFMLFGNLRLDETDVSETIQDANHKTTATNKTTESIRPKGLSNLGNTCYLNSIIQVLAHTPLFCETYEKRNADILSWSPETYDEIVQRFKKKLDQLTAEVNMEPEVIESAPVDQDASKDTNFIGQESKGQESNDTKGAATRIVNSGTIKWPPSLQVPNLLVSCFVRLLHELRSRLGTQTISPNAFLREITSVFKRFHGYEQQDSHELLRCLLDAVKNEENRRQKKTILSAFNVDVRRAQPSDATAAQVKNFSLATRHTLIDAFFGGYCISSLKCEECESTSQIFEPFYDLSLPITEDRQHHHTTNVRRNKKSKDDLEEGELEATNPTAFKATLADISRLMDGDDKKRLTKGERKKLRSLKKEQTRERRRELRQKGNRKGKENVCQTKEAEVASNGEKIESAKATQLQSNADARENVNDVQETKAESADDEKEKSNKCKEQDLNSYNEDNETHLNKDEEIGEVNVKDSLMEEDDSLQSVASHHLFDKQTVIDDEKKTSDGECSDDEASGKDFDADALEEQSEDKSLTESNKLVLKNFRCSSRASRLERAQTNSTDSGINYPTFTSDGDGNTNSGLSQPIDTSNVIEASKCDGKMVDDDRATIEGKIQDSTNESNLDEKNGLSGMNGDADSESEESTENSVVSDNESDSNAASNMNRKASLHKCCVDALFDGQIDRPDKRIRTNSTNESEEEQRQKAKWTLSTISSKSDSMPVTSILSCLSRFTSLELLGGANKINCENCTQRHKRKTGQDKKVYTHASKRMLIALPPPILTLHLKRFEVNSHRLSLCKVNRHVPFPLLFDLSPYVSNLYKVIASSLSDDPSQVCNAVVYSLYGIVEHAGSLRSGHYKAYVRYRSKDEDLDALRKFIHLTPLAPKMEHVLEMIKTKHTESIDELSESSENNLDFETIKNKLPELHKKNWYHISDSSVIPVSLSTVLKAQAYLLFYERIV